METLGQFAVVIGISIAVGIVWYLGKLVWMLFVNDGSWCPVCDEDHKDYKTLKVKDATGLPLRHCKICNSILPPVLVHHALRIRLNTKTAEDGSMIVEDREPESPMSRATGRMFFGTQMQKFCEDVLERPEEALAWGEWASEILRRDVLQTPEYTPDEEAVAWQRIGNVLVEVGIH